jgi:hypothetical protein
MIHFLDPMLARPMLNLGQAPPAGYSNWGGSGVGPTGLKDSPGVAAKPGFAAITSNQSFYVILRTTGVAQQAPPMFVPPGASVSIRAHNGANTGNTNVVYVGHQPELLAGTGGDPITPDSDISWPCNSCGEIWVNGTAGDGIRVSIQAQRG